jgi:predicted nucleic acid-binding protein
VQDKVFLDTNILVYLSNEDSSFYQDATRTFEKLTGEYESWVSRQVLREYAVIMTRPDIIEKPLSSIEVAIDIEKWQSIFQIADETEDVTKILLNLIKTYDIKGKKIHDANIIATMLVNGINLLYTFNSDDFVRFEEIKLFDSEKD